MAGLDWSESGADARSPGAKALAELSAESLGRGHRDDPVCGRTGGPAGNARLTAWLGLLALVLIGAELLTLLDVTGLISWHTGIGIALTALALVKMASTSWRMARYYLRSEPYVEAGPPPMLLRLLGPFVVLTTLGVLGSGLALIALGRRSSEQPWFAVLGQSVSPVTLHQAFFVLFGVFVGVHILARVVPAAVLVSGRRRIGAPRMRVPGRAARFGVLTGGMAAALVAVLLVLPTVADWNHHVFDRDDLHHTLTR
jgi:cytochrome b561